MDDDTTTGADFEDDIDRLFDLDDEEDTRDTDEDK